ncbi:MAG TPA: hypothetical protein VHC43_03115 [Mycobacteriales bacterium]|nr:hypothetical protein [Mycobacteriales bacterium]
MAGAGLPDQAIPSGGRLVHIGFDKTGTTSLQGAFHSDRERLREHGVLYPGNERYHKSAGIAITNARGNTGDAPVTMGAWRDLVSEVKAARSSRVFVSSEWLCRATDEQARLVVRGLGGDRVRVVATLRPLSKILPSAWQQYVKDGYVGDYESWLRDTLSTTTPGPPTPWFWIRHRHDVVLQRWAKLVGSSNVTAIVVDSRDHDLLFRQFEALLALPAGFLVAKPESASNASLTWPEAELLRQVNLHFQAEQLSDELYSRAVRSGVLPRLAASRAELANPVPIPTPTWALERAAEIGATAAAAIDASGIHVLGDLASLGAVPSSSDESDPSREPAVDFATAAQAIVGVIAGTKAERPPRPAPSRWRRTRRIDPLPEF